MMAVSLASMWLYARVHVGLKTFLTILLLSVLGFVLTRKSHSDLS